MTYCEQDPLIREGHLSPPIIRREQFYIQALSVWSTLAIPFNINPFSYAVLTMFKPPLMSLGRLSKALRTLGLPSGPVVRALRCHCWGTEIPHAI